MANTKNEISAETLSSANECLPGCFLPPVMSSMIFLESVLSPADLFKNFLSISSKAFISDDCPPIYL